LRFEIDHEHNRYPETIELNVFQIIQQAVENVLAHAGADVIVVRGKMEPDRITLEIEDDGCGFEFGETIEPAWLLKHRKFGIVGMLERATLIDASVLITSRLGQGTRIRLTWEQSQWQSGS
jgi:two-component system sensor histidine kinase DegS